MAHPQLFTLNIFIKNSMELYKNMRDQVLLTQDINPDHKPINFMDYAQYILRNGTLREKREVASVLNRQLYIHNETVTSVPLITNQ